MEQVGKLALVVPLLGRVRPICVDVLEVDVAEHTRLNSVLGCFCKGTDKDFLVIIPRGAGSFQWNSYGVSLGLQHIRRQTVGSRAFSMLIKHGE